MQKHPALCGVQSIACGREIMTVKRQTLDQSSNEEMQRILSLFTTITAKRNKMKKETDACRGCNCGLLCLALSSVWSL